MKKNALAAIRLIKTRRKTKSKLGGKPNLPPEIPWPVSPSRRELDFLAQIHCPDLPKGLGLPEEGTLFFFYDMEKQPWGHNQRSERRYWRVIYAEGNLPSKTRTRKPSSEYDYIPVFRECFLKFKTIVTVQDWAYSNSDDYDDCDDYGICHQMLGHASFIQTFGYTPKDILLLQLETDKAYDDSPGWSWGDMGTIYFWISPADLENRNFTKVKVQVECH